MPYGLKEIELEKLDVVFAANERIERVVLYGSRAKGNYKPFSDVDITLEGPELTHTDLSRLSLAIDDLLLPYQFDISIFHTLKNEALIDHIRRIGITIYERKSEWKDYKLGEIASFITEKVSVQEIGIEDYISTENMLADKGGITIASSKPTEGSATKYYTDTILISNIRPYFKKIWYANKDGGCSNDVLCFKAKEGIVDSKYLYFLLSQDTFFDYVMLGSKGCKMPRGDKSHIMNWEISMPSLSTQRRIASILSSLDDKIDLLHRENATLEQMAETLFRQWFVEEAKEVWEEVPLEYVCERITDGSHYSPESVESGLPMASVKDMENWGIDLNSCRKISKEEFDKLVSADCLPQVNDILIAKDGSYLKHIFVVDKMQEVVILSSIAILRPNGLYHPYLLSILLKLDSTKEELKNIVTGAVIPRIVLKDFRKFQILLPPIEKQKQALSFIEPIMKKCFYNNEQTQTLIQIRDGLLPKLMGGEVKL